MRGDISHWYPVIPARTSRVSQLIPGSRLTIAPLPSPRRPLAVPRRAPRTPSRAPVSCRPRPSPRPQAPTREPHDRPHVTSAGFCCDRPRGSSGGSPRTPPAGHGPPPPTAQATTVDRSAYLGEKAPETRRWWSTARRGEADPLDGQAFAPLRAATLEHLSPALRLHARSEAVGLLPTALIWLERALHERLPLSDP